MTIYSFMLVLLSFFLFNEPIAFPEQMELPLGLKEIPWPKDNPYSKEKAELGRVLYFDKRLSSDGTVACATCHHAPCGYSDCKPLPVGIKGQQGSRHSPTVINSAYAKFYFWDGRASSLEEQCKGPLANTKEMTLVDDAHEAHLQCQERVDEIAGYKRLFKDAFGSEEVTIDRIAKAIATFERTILSGNSPYDRYKNGDTEALTEEEIVGLHVFKAAKCSVCHGGFNFADTEFKNIGVGMDKENPDLGRYAITGREKDWGAFKVPTLREVEHTAPYMHDGSLATLEEVVDYYNKGGIKNKNLSRHIVPLNLSTEEKQALVSFMKALSGEGWQAWREPEEFP